MKIFVAYASKDGEGDHSRVEDIKTILSGKHKVDAFCHKITADGKTSKDSLEVLHRVKEADIFIGEMATASQTLGFLLAHSLNLGKPSLYLYPSDSMGQPGGIITHNPSRLLFVEDYNNINLEKKLRKFIDIARSKLRSSRTTFVSTKAIDDYINEVSKKEGLSRGETIRRALEESIKS